ncbi:abortive infection family protein [Halomonas sp. A40-4]|uniref:abortive infection family protein n=1 Tax=Halomonas sp. A40-4 TaxID=2785909 RepID=UPI0022774B6B|nr:abortive infection family protein [Halomonas sp. A40-4]
MVLNKVEDSGYAILNGKLTVRPLSINLNAHGKVPRPAKPKPRHAELAVNLAGTMAAFLIATLEARTHP